MELLERDRALAAFAEAWAAAAGGAGRAIIVSGEPGIGKTTLVTRVVRDLGPSARVLLGACDDLTTPRPLGPFRDLVAVVAPGLAAAIEGDAPPHEVHQLLLAELERPPRPTLLVLEDVHWADDATIDAISVLGRRIGSLPAVLVLTVRSGEVGPAHPIHAALAAVPADHAIRIDLQPLSADAVASLARGAADAGAVFALTGGNPFYVSEILAARTTEPLPASIATSVLARASRLPDDSRGLVELIAMVPGRTPTAILDAALPGWLDAAVEPERRRLLEVDPLFVRFRHELARHAIRDRLPAASRRRLHGVILDVLLGADGDPAEIVHHAEAAGAEDVLVAHVLVAARRAAALGSNREAYAHFRRAADVLVRFPPDERARILEELAMAAYGAGKLDAGFVAIERAIAGWRAIGDVAGTGRSTRFLSRLHWFAGNGALARRAISEAIDILEPLGDSSALARAYSDRSQLAMLADDGPDAIEWGERALELATRLGDDRTRAHAMINVGTAKLKDDPDRTAVLFEAHRIADAAGDGHEATRALGNIAYTAMAAIRPGEALELADRALAYAARHEVDALAPYLSLIRAWMDLRAGRWSEAEERALAGRTGDISVTYLLADTILAELAIRRGDPDAAERLADIANRADRAWEPQRIEPALELACEWALLGGSPLPVAGLAVLLRRIAPPDVFAVRAAGWATVSGQPIEPSLPAAVPVPHAAMIRGDWRGAADAFGAVGWSYDRALLLSLLDDEAALDEALELARGLAAGPLERRVAGRLRELGMAVPRGRRAATRGNPAGLTGRQFEVLGLMIAGLTNAEIADRLVVSERTAEHHVSAVLAKLDATTRRDAARRVAELGLAVGGEVDGSLVSDG